MSEASSRDAVDLDVQTAYAIIGVLAGIRERGITATYIALHSSIGDRGIIRVCQALIAADQVAEPQRPTETPREGS